MPSLGRSRMGSGSKKKQKRMKQNLFRTLAFCSMALLLFACNGRSKNRKIVEAQEIHQTMMAKHDSIYKAIQIQEERVEKKLNSLSPNNPDRAAFQSMDRSIKRSYNLLDSWRENVTDVPGYGSEGARETDSSDGESTDKLSDQEILDLQKAYKTKLDQIDQKIDELITTMEMYTK